MTVEYTMTIDDLTAFNQYHHLHSPTIRQQYLRSWFVPPFIWLLILTGIWYLADRNRGTPVQTFLDLLPLFCGVPFYLIYFPWEHRRKVRKIISGMVSEGQNRGLFGRHQIVISSDGIADSSEFGQDSTTWRAVERIVQSNDFAFIYINAIAAIIVPRRAFPERHDFEMFLQAARDYHEAAKG